MATVRRTVPGVRGWIVAAVLAVVLALAVQGTAQAAPAEASYYGAGLAGQTMANGEPFNPYANTAAHKTLPLGTVLQVSYGGQTTYVTVTDRGPYVGGRDLDLSYGAAQDIGLVGAGVGVVDVEVVHY